MKGKIISGILVVLWMITIFYFSHQPSEISGETSETIAKDILKATHIIDLISKENKEETINHFDRIIRKVAHYTIYTFGGILIFIFINKYKNDEKKKITYSYTLGTIYAISDEIHQYYIPGRACMWQDVCLDSLGVLTGVITMILVFEVIKRNNY